MSTIQLPPREVTPPNYIPRVQPAPVFKKLDPKAQFLADLAKFQANSSEFEMQASEYLYDNQEAGDHEYRVHCHLLGALIADGQALIIQANANEISGIEAEKQFAQQKIDKYIATMNDWHGAPGSHSDESEAFKQGMRETDLTDPKTGDL